MKKHYIAVLAIVVLLTVVWLGLRTRHVEGFENRVQDTCTVYFTDDTAACDAPKDVNGVHIDFSYHRKYYETLKQNMEAKGGNMNAAEAAKYATILDVLRQYDKMVDGQSCKLTIDNWKQLSDAGNTVKLGDLEQNKQRNVISDWAFCVNGNVGDNRGLIEKQGNKHMLNGLEIAMNKDETPYIVHNGPISYLRGNFPDFKYETMKTLFCAETAGKSFAKFSGLQIDPFQRKVIMIEDGNTTSTVSTDIFTTTNVYFEEAVREGNLEKVYLRTNLLTKPVYKIDRDLCSRDQHRLTGSYIKIYFGANNNPIKETNISDAHLLGTRADLRAKRAEIVTLRNKANEDLNKIKPMWDLKNNHKQFLDNKNNKLRKDLKNMRNKLNRLGKAQKGVSASTSLAVIPGLGQLMAIGAGFASIGIAVERKKLKKKIKKKEAEQTGLNKQCGGTSDSYCNRSLKCEVAPTGKNCPYNIPLMKTLYDDTNNVYDPLQKNAKAYDDQIRAIDAKLEDMDEKIRQFLTVMIQSGSFTIADPPYEALSWDNKFYIKL